MGKPNSSSRIQNMALLATECLELSGSKADIKQGSFNMCGLFIASVGFQWKDASPTEVQDSRLK